MFKFQCVNGFYHNYKLHLIITHIIFKSYVRPDLVQFYGAVTYILLPGFVLGLKKAFKKPKHVADDIDKTISVNSKTELFSYWYGLGLLTC